MTKKGKHAFLTVAPKKNEQPEEEKTNASHRYEICAWRVKSQTEMQIKMKRGKKTSAA